MRHLLRFIAPVLLLAGAHTAQAATTTTTGEQSTVVLLVNYSDSPTQPITKTAAHSLVFGQASDFYWEASYHRMFLSGDTYGWFTLPVSKATCDTALIAQEADKAAAAAGIDLSRYAHRVYLAPDNACTGTGYNDGMTLPTRTWIFAEAMNARLVAHEMGHNFGLSHSQALECGNVSYSATCTVKSYGDAADTMGSGTTPHFNALQKLQLGWLGATGAPPVTTVAATGRYRIERLEDGTGTKALKVARGIDSLTGEMTYYTLEYRQPVGFDAVLGTVGNLTKGVLLHMGGVNQYSMLLDATPNSAASQFDDINDSALAVGRTYRDDAVGIAFTVVAADASGATIDVTVPASAPPPPPPPPTDTTGGTTGGTTKGGKGRK
jgi:hypothetical protein